jgi:catechol 2,3-dioxygenase-like lactoylglutathione lyase family enzyme
MDCADIEQMTRFWSAALGYRVGGELGPFRALRDPDGVGPKVVLQRVADPTPGKNRLHLDLYVEDRADLLPEVDRLVGLGARRVEAGWFELGDESWQVMNDPEGNVFCVCVH